MDKEVIYYLFAAVVIALFSWGHPPVALLGFSFFLTLLLMMVPWVQKFYKQFSLWGKILAVGISTLILFVPSYFITPFFSAVVVFLGSYFLILLLFTVCQKVYMLLLEPRLRRHAILVPYLYFVVGLIIIFIAQKAIEEAIARPSGKMMALVGIMLGISFLSTTLRLLSSQSKKKQFLQQRTWLLAFFIFLFSFLSRATGEGIILLKTISNTGIVLFLFALPLLRLWKNRKRQHQSMREIVESVFRE